MDGSRNLYGHSNGLDYFLMDVSGRNGVLPAFPGNATTTGSRLKKHLNFLPWKKSKSKTDAPEPVPLARHKKFGSVSALSSSALYRDFDKPFVPTAKPSSAVKHATVRCAGDRVRAMVYPWETYEQALPKPAAGRVPAADRPPAKVPGYGSRSKKAFGTVNPRALQSPEKCSCFSSVRSSYGVFAPPPPPRRKSILPSAGDLYSVHEEGEDNQRRGQKAGGRSKAGVQLARSLDKKDPFSSLASRKSILECDVTAYKLIKDYLKTSEDRGLETDSDDDLSDNAVEDGSQRNKDDPSPASEKSPSPTSTESESGIYSHTSSIRVGGQGMKLFPSDQSQASSVYSDSSKTNSVDSTWSAGSVSDDGIYSLPEPDYDDDSELEYGALRFKDLKLCYSPVPVRKNSVPPPPPTVRRAASMIALSPRTGSTDAEQRTARQTDVLCTQVHGCASPEVKSILKKTTDKAGSVRDVRVPQFRDHKDAKQKKRVKFKSLSSESLAVDQVKRDLSSSDDDWEEEVADCSRQLDVRGPGTVDDGFQTVEEFLSAENRPQPVSTPRSPVVTTSNPVCTPPKPVIRPSQPPPPPPLPRSGPPPLPPPRPPLVTSPKYGSCSNLRTGPASSYRQINPALPDRGGQPNTKVTEVAGLRFNKQEIISVPKNGITSPAIRTAATRGKTTADTFPSLNVSAPCPAAGRPVLVDQSSCRVSENTTRSHLSLRQTGDSCLDVKQTVQDSSVPSSAVDSSWGEGQDSIYQNIVVSITNNPCHKSSADQSPRAVWSDSRPATGRLQAQKKAITTGERDAITCTIIASPQQQPCSNSGGKDRRSALVSRDVPLADCHPPRLPKEVPDVDSKMSEAPSPSWRISASTDRNVAADTSRDPTTDSENGRRTSIVTISSNGDRDDIYTEVTTDAIYEELPPSRRATPSDWPPVDSPWKSFFEGASKAEILNYLKDAKERVEAHMSEEFSDELTLEEDITEAKTSLRNTRNRISNISNSSESSNQSESSSSPDDGSPQSVTCKYGRSSAAEVERNDSGVGPETSKPPRLRRQDRSNNAEHLCADCDQQVETLEGEVSLCPLVCKKCSKKRSERKEIITEVVETELKYGRDLRVIKEEFCCPMEVAGLLTKDQLNGVFLNLDELITVNSKFSEKLKDAVDIAVEQGDEDFTTVNIGKLFLESTAMLHAFETYCVKQGSASLLLSNLEKEKELLGIFLRVSQMENTLLRRMNLSAFLMVPVQRVTKYPLLLNRLYKVTPYHHQDREALRESQLKIELHLEHINQQTKGSSGAKIWRRISNISAQHRRIVGIADIGSIKLRKMAIEVLKWSREEIRFVMAGKLLYTPVADMARSRKAKTVKFGMTHALLAALGKPNTNYRPDLVNENSILFPRNTGIRDATLLLVKEKNGRFSLAREPLHLGKCVISCDDCNDEAIEIQEYTSKESVILKAECRSETQEWLRQLRYHAKDLGTWRRRRNALANIMINGMTRH